VAVQREDGADGAAIWLFDVARGASTRLRSGAAYDFGPVWSPDGRRIMFVSQRERWEIYETGSNGEGDEVLVVKEGEDLVTEDWSSDGKYVMYGAIAPQTRMTDLLALRRGAKSSRPIARARTSFDENFGRFSPDRRWIVYQSDESGRYEIYARSVSVDGTLGGKTTVSVNGGIEPRWPRKRNELFYIRPDNMLMAVEIKPGATLEVGTPRPLFLTRPAGVLRYDVTADGERFLVSVPVEDSTSAPATVVLNWYEELKRHVLSDR